MKYKRRHKQSYNVVNSLLLDHHEKVETILNYKSTFGLTKGKKYNCDAKASTGQREQYGGTVHLFIGTGHSPCKMIQRGSESNANKVLAQEGNCSVNLASQGHCAGVFIGA
jgi:hypothetical protein